jgi:hypothetical protein
LNVSHLLEFVAGLCIAVGAIWVSGIGVIAAIDALRSGRRRSRGFVNLSRTWPADPIVRGPYARLTKPASGPF